MRGGTSKGCMFLREDLPADRAEWDPIFLQVMGSPDPKQIDGMGGTVSSNNKIVIVWKSEMPGVDVIAGVDGTAAELKVKFLSPAGAKTGVLLPTGNFIDILDIPGHGKIEATILDVSNPMVLVNASDVGLKGTELPEEINNNKEACEILEKIRGTACCMMGFAGDLKDATESSP